MNRKILIGIIIIASITAFLLTLLILKPKSEIKTIPANYQEQSLPVNEEEVSVFEDEKPVQSEIVTIKKEPSKTKNNMVKKTSSKINPKKPPIETIVEGNSIRIAIPEATAQDKKVPVSEPRTTVVVIDKEYKIKSPDKYSFK